MQNVKIKERIITEVIFSVRRDMMNSLDNECYLF